MEQYFPIGLEKGICVREKKVSSHLGIEPRTFGLEVQRAIHCANGTQDTHWLLKMVLFRNAEKVSARIEYH